MIRNSAGVGIAVGSLFCREWKRNSKQTLTAKTVSHGRAIHRGAGRDERRLRGFLKGERGHIAQGRMSSLALVKHFDVIEQARAGGFASFVTFVMHQLLLERRDEALGRSVGGLSPLACILADCSAASVDSQQLPLRLMLHSMSCCASTP